MPNHAGHECWDGHVAQKPEVGCRLMCSETTINYQSQPILCRHQKGGGGNTHTYRHLQFHTGSKFLELGFVQTTSKFDFFDEELLGMIGVMAQNGPAIGTNSEWGVRHASLNVLPFGIESFHHEPFFLDFPLRRNVRIPRPLILLIHMHASDLHAYQRWMESNRTLNVEQLSGRKQTNKKQRNNGRNCVPVPTEPKTITRCIIIPIRKAYSSSRVVRKHSCVISHTS